MANLAIKGHATRGKEVIKILEMLGGKSYAGLAYKGEDPDRYYCIDKETNFINASLIPKGFQVFSLEEFLEKFHYKVGDKVYIKKSKKPEPHTITEIHWNEFENTIQYVLKIGPIYQGGWETNSLHPYKEETMDKANKAVFDANAHCCDIMNRLIKEETMEEIKIDIPKGYEFAGVDDDKQQVVFVKMEYQYPKTYEECAKIMNCPIAGPSGWLFNFDANIKDKYYRKIDILMGKFTRLLICRDAYWKIAGEQMGLGKPWEPDWLNTNSNKYCIYYVGDEIKKQPMLEVHHLLAFPTAEMRDAFFENFKDLIEQCKELL